MSALKQAIEKAIERRHIAPTLPVQAQDVAQAPAEEHTAKPKRASLALDELRRQPHTAQLNALRSHFENCITQPSRYVDQQQLSRWTRGSRCTDREYSTAASGTAHGLRWSKDLESDIASVVTEAGLSGAASAAVVDAAKKGAIADNPGVLLCQIMALQSALDPHLGRRAVTSLIRVMPTLLNTSSDTLAWHYEELMAMFGPGPAASLAVKAPSVLGMAPFMIWSKLTNIQSLLGTSIEQAQALALRQPRLLAAAQTALESRLKELQSLFRLGGKQLRRLVANQPALLTYTPATLASNMAAMARCLGTTEEQTAKLLSRSPTLLMLSPSTVSAKIAAITALLDCTPAQATAVVTRQPTVLSISSDLLSQKLTQVGAALRTTPKETAQVLRSNPALLTLSSGTLAKKLGKLRDAVAAAAEVEQACGLVHIGQLPQQQHEQHRHLNSVAQAAPFKGKVAQQASTSAPHAVLYPPASTSASNPSPITTFSTKSTTATSSTSNNSSRSTSSKSTSSRSGSRSRSTAASALTHSATPSHPQNLASAWLEQLQSHSPQQRASLACFSEKRYARLPALAAARVAARAGLQQGLVGAVQLESTAVQGVQGAAQERSSTAAWAGLQKETFGAVQQEGNVVQGASGPVQGEQNGTGGSGIQQLHGVQNSMGGCRVQQLQQQHGTQREGLPQHHQQVEERLNGSGRAAESAAQHTSTGLIDRVPASKEAFCVGSHEAAADGQQQAKQSEEPEQLFDGQQQEQEPSGLPCAGEAGSDCSAKRAGSASRSRAVGKDGGEAGRSSSRVPSLASLLRMTDAKFKAVMDGVV